MKTVLKKSLSIVLALVMIVSVFTCSFSAYAESTSETATPDWQTYLTNGKELKDYLEKNFLNLDEADKLFLTNSESISNSLCSQLGALFLQMGYAKEDYPKTQKDLTFCLARAISSLNPSIFTDPDRIQTVDVSLLYNLAYIGGTDYIAKINSNLPEELRFDTSKPVISLTASQKQTLTEYYAKWKTGALSLNGFDFREYLGELDENEFLKDVLLVLIADNDRLPAIINSATNAELTSDMKYALARAVADIMDNLTAKPVSALLRQLSDPDFQSVLKIVLEVAGKVTVSTDYYAYKLYTKGIYTDTGGSAIEYIKDNGDGTYSYNGPTLVSSYSELIDNVLKLFDGLYTKLNSSVLDAVFKDKFTELEQVVYSAVDVASDVVASKQNKLNSDIACAEIEIRYANEQIKKLQNGNASAEEISALNAKIEENTSKIFVARNELSTLEDTIAVKKDSIKGYYDIMADLNAQIKDAETGVSEKLQAYNSAKSIYENLKNTDEADYTGDYTVDLQTALDNMNTALADYNSAKETAQSTIDSIKASNDYVTAKAKIDALDASLSDTYSAVELKKAEIKELSAEVDYCETQIKAINNGEGITDKVNIWKSAITKAQAIIDAGNKELKDLASKELIDYSKNTISALLKDFFKAFDGVYKEFCAVPVKAAVTLINGLSDFAKRADEIDWDYLAPVTDELFANADLSINNSLGRYLGENGGANILTDLSKTVSDLLDQYGILTYTDLTSLDKFIADEILCDNSDVLKQAATALQAMFPNIEPSYNSIISCIIPILSSFNFSSLMDNISDITGLLSYASPTAFSYLAGMDNGDYFVKLNKTLSGYAGLGTQEIKTVITLSSAKQTELQKYVDMEKSGKSLQEIAGAGFVWSNYIGSASTLDIADMLVKIDLADDAKLGDIASAEGVGGALINLLFGLIPEAKTQPVSTILKRISNTDIKYIVDFALSLLNGADTTYKSYDLFFSQNVFEDKDGNPAFYATIKDGNYVYSGPEALGNFVPLIGAVLDFAGGLYTEVKVDNSGDLLKTVLVSRASQLQNLLLSAQDLVVNLLYNTDEYNHANNYIMCIELLEGLKQNEILKANEQIAGYNTQIGVWNTYLESVLPMSDSAKLAKAKELGLFDESVASFSDEALLQAIEADTQKTNLALTNAQSSLAQKQAELVTLQNAVSDANNALEEFSSWQDSFYEDPFYSDLDAILADQDADLIDTLRTDCKADIDAHMGAGAFENLATIIQDNMADYEGDPDTFIDDFIYNDGLNTYLKADELDKALTQANTDVSACHNSVEKLNSQISSLDTRLSNLASGAYQNQVNNAGNIVTIHISDASINAEGDFSAKDIIEAVNTIRTEYIAGYEDSIAKSQSEIDSYNAEKAKQQEIISKYNEPQISAVKSAYPQIVSGAVKLITGAEADGSKNIYYYIKSGNILGILLDNGRLDAIHEIINAVYEPLVEELVSKELINREIADKIIAMKPSADTFYESYVAPFPDAFSQNVVNAVADLISGIYGLFGAVYNSFSDIENLPADVEQSKKIADDVASIFDENFKTDWSASYTKCGVTRINETYNLLVDILGLSFIQKLIPEVKCGSLKGKLNTNGLYGDINVNLEQSGTVIKSVTISASGDGSFEFTDVSSGVYSVSVSALGTTSFTVNSINVSDNYVTDLCASEDETIGNIKIALGDVDKDGTVGVSDIAVILLNENYGQSTASGASDICDLDRDGSITVGDVSIILMAENYGQTSASAEL